MVAANRDGIYIDKLAFHENGNRRGAAAHINNDTAKVALFGAKAGHTSAIACMQKPLGFQMVQRQCLAEIRQ